MEQKYDVRTVSPPHQRVRELGYDPDHLTQQEQVELLAIERRMSSAQRSGRKERASDGELDFGRPGLEG